MILLEEKIKFDQEDKKKHFTYPFALEREYDLLIITLQYEPSLVPEVRAKELAKCTAQEYIPQDYVKYDMVFDIMENFNILNILSLSLSKEGDFIGSYHNEKNNQTIVISENDASYGFSPVKITKGNYILTLSTLNVNSMVEGTLKVEGIR